MSNTMAIPAAPLEPSPNRQFGQSERLPNIPHHQYDIGGMGAEAVRDALLLESRAQTGLGRTAGMLLRRHDDRAVEDSRALLSLIGNEFHEPREKAPEFRAHMADSLNSLKGQLEMAESIGNKVWAEAIRDEIATRERMLSDETQG